MDNTSNDKRNFAPIQKVRKIPATGITMKKVPHVDPLRLPATLGYMSSGIWLMVLLFGLVYNCLIYKDSTHIFASFLFVSVLVVVPCLALLGTIALLDRMRLGLARAGAVALMIPIYGVGFGLLFPLGIWILVLLNREDIRSSFGRAKVRPQNVNDLQSWR